LPKANRRRRSWWCRAGWSTWSSVLTAPLAAAGRRAGLALAGCGFKLRQPPRCLFRSIALTGFAPRSPLATELRRQLALQVVCWKQPDKADVVLHALEDVRERSVVASTAAAQVRELQLRVKLRSAHAHAPGGRELIPGRAAAGRDMSYSEAALAKEFEEAELYREMQTDVVAQVMRRLATINL
jgi:LPS-assembly lipoprotein